MSNKSNIRMTEEEMRDLRAPTPPTLKALGAYFAKMARESDGKANTAYGLALSTEAAFNFVAAKIGALPTHQQVADVIYLRNRRDMRMGFTLVNHADLLDPDRVAAAPVLQAILLHVPPPMRATFRNLVEGAAENVPAHVLAHWKKYAAEPVPLPVIDASALDVAANDGIPT